MARGIIQIGSLFQKTRTRGQTARGSVAIDSSITIDIATVPEEEAEVKLRPVSFSYGALDIPPADPIKGYSDSRFTMTCDFQSLFQSKFGTAPDYNIYRQLNVETEVHDIAVLHNVFLTFDR